MQNNWSDPLSEKLPPTGRANLPAAPRNSNLTQVLAQRLSPSQAIDLVSRLLQHFPNCKAEDGFIRALAEMFAGYPKPVALEIVGPRGLAMSEQFLSLASAKQWLDNRCAPLWEEAERSKRVQEQTAAARDWNAPRMQSLLIKTRRWLDRDDEVAKALAEEHEKSERERRARANTAVLEAGRQKLLDEYEAEGVEPFFTGADKSMPVSLSLLKSLGAEIVEDEGRRIVALKK